MKINFNPQNLEQNIKNILTDYNKVILLVESKTTWDKIFVPLDLIDNILNQETTIYSHLNSVCFNENFNVEYEKILPLISDFYSELGTNKNLYKTFKNLLKTNLNIKQQYILKNILLNFKLSGINLTKHKKKQYKQISARLSLLSNKFAKNSLKATNIYQKIISKNDLKGLNNNELIKLENNKSYILSLQMPQYLAVMTYCDNVKIRQELYIAYISRASKFDNFDNGKIMQEILDLRLKLATLLGFDNYAQYSLVNKMVKNIEEVELFLNQLIDSAKLQAKKELHTLNSFAGLKLEPWDLLYYSEKQKIQQYGFSKTEIANYFPFKTVLSGLLKLIKDLYNLKAQIIKETTYHQDVIVIKFDNGSKVYLDPFARKNKKSGAWMSDYQNLNGRQKPIAFIVCNASMPTKSIPSLLEFDDVITLFHEFGHALHHILTEVKYPSVAGIEGVPWDGVELPSQYMEFFAYEKSVIKQISKHYKTGKSLPNNLFKKLIASKNYGSAMAMLRQCEFSLWDILTHSSTENTYDILAKVRKKTALLPTIEKNCFLNTFGHIFSGGYAAGYYSYKWAEVLAADAYAIIAKDKNKTNNFRKYILATGGQSDFMQNYLQFSQKNPKIDALLKANGIK